MNGGSEQVHNIQSNLQIQGQRGSKSLFSFFAGLRSSDKRRIPNLHERDYAAL